MANREKSLRIGIDARLWNETGVGRYIRNLIFQLQKIDNLNKYKLFTLSKDVSSVQSSIVNNKWSIIPADIPWHTLGEQIEFPKILKKENLDLVHFPYFSIPIGYKGKYILTIHDLILHHFPTGKASTHSSLVYWLKHAGYKYVIKQAAKHAEKIITVSNATKQEIIDHLHIPRDKIVVTYEGIDTKIKNEKLKMKNFPKEYFLYVGNAYPHKNLETLLQAFQNLKYKTENVKGIKLILVGKKDYFYTRMKEKVKEMGLAESIIFRHDVSDEELASLYTHTLALIVPSLMEGFGLPLLEAMAHKCLVVASDIPVFHEIAKNVPLYFQTTDVNSLVNVLESIAKGRIKDAKERKEKGALYANKFSWEKMAHQTLEVYKSCLGV